MKATIAMAFALLTAAMPLAAAAQSPAGSDDLQLEMKRKRAIVLPKQSPEEVRSDADRAVEEYAAARRSGAVADQNSPVRPPARPDLDRDVKGGIQSQRVNDALRNR